MKVFRFHEVQHLPITLNQAWAFFSNPANLSEITPPSLNLRVTNELPSTMHPGMIITYRVRPLAGIPFNWVTEITHVIEGRLFVDEQRFGPYRFWHHQHHFRETERGLRMDDIVHYGLPAGPFSSIIDRLVVRKQLDGIFQYRRQVLETKFGAP